MHAEQDNKLAIRMRVEVRTNTDGDLPFDGQHVSLRMGTIALEALRAGEYACSRPARLRLGVLVSSSARCTPFTVAEYPR